MTHPLRRLAEDRFDPAVVRVQRGPLIGEVRAQGGKQALFLDRGMRFQDGGDGAGQHGQFRYVVSQVRPAHPADERDHHVVFAGQLLDGGQRLAAAVLAHSAQPLTGIPATGSAALRTAVLASTRAANATTASRTRPSAYEPNWP